MRTPSIRPLSDTLSAIAKSELNENPKTIPDDLDALKSWLSKQNHIKARQDDQFLLAFLRGCKFSLERAKEKVDMYYSIRSTMPEFFDNRDPQNEKLQRVMSLGLSLPLPLIDESSGRRLYLIRQGAYNPSEISILDVMKVSYMITDLLIWEDDNTIIAGETVLIDLKGLSFAHISQLNPTLLKKMTSSIQEAYPIRQKGIHFINSSSGFETVFKIFYSFMNDKIKKRIFVHDSFESLHKHIPKRLLPTEYGGEVESIQEIAQKWSERLIEKREWFLEEMQFKSDESQRPAKARNSADLFGNSGSFRKLDID